MRIRQMRGQEGERKENLYCSVSVQLPNIHLSARHRVRGRIKKEEGGAEDTDTAGSRKTKGSVLWKTWSLTLK